MSNSGQVQVSVINGLVRSPIGRRATSSHWASRLLSTTTHPGSLLDEIVIDCVEPSSDGPGGLFSTTQPSGATGLRGDGTPRSDRFTTDGMVPPPDDVLVPMVTDFVLQQLRTAASPPPGEPKPLAG